MVLATYNGDRFLSEQLESLERQSRLPDEVIIVDDHSTDGTAALLTSFAHRARFPVDLTIFEERMGTWEAFATAISRSSGQIILICDQDDRWAPEKVAVMVERMEANPDALLALSDSVLIDQYGGFLSRSRWRVAGFGPPSWVALAEDPFGQMLARQIVSGCTAAIRSELVPALLPFPEDLHVALGTMMYDRWISLLGAVVSPILLVPERLVEYRIHPGQQVGIPGLPVRRFLPRASLQLGQFRAGRVEKNGRYAYSIAHLEEIEKRLDVNDLLSADAELKLRLAREHLETRSGLPAQRRLRARPVLQHLVEVDGYRRFSLGLSTALADLLR